MIKVEVLEKLLQDNSQVSAYEIEQTDNEGRQLYFVLGKLETNRAVKVENISVTVYHDFDGFRGSSSFEVTASDNEESLKGKIADCVKKAAQVRNPYYPLAEKKENIHKEKKLEEPISASLKKVADAIFSADHFENSSLNATELFGDLTHTRFLNSNGVDHSYDSVSLFFESIPSYNSEKDEYELYYSEDDGSFATDHLKETMEEQLKNVRYRAEAVTLKEADIPKGVDVHVKGEMLAYLMNNFAYELSYQKQFMKSSHYKLGDVISKSPFDLTLKGEEEGALTSSPIDGHGLNLGETKVIEQGKANALWGDLRFGSYLKVDDITGQYRVMVMDNYQPVSEEEYSRPHITILNFSAPQLDAASGYFGGEVRLALYHDKDKVIPLTGFSISGNIYEAIHEAEFSADTGFVNNKRMSFKGPKVMVLKNMTIH